MRGAWRAIDVVLNNWTDAITEMFPPVMVTHSARILASRPIKLVIIYISDSIYLT